MLTGSTKLRCVTLLIALSVSLTMAGCKKFSQDVETIETSSIGGSGSSGSSGGSNDNGNKDYTDDYGANYYLGTPSNETNAINGLFLGDKKTWGYGSHWQQIQSECDLPKGPLCRQK